MNIYAQSKRYGLSSIRADRHWLRSMFTPGQIERLRKGQIVFKQSTGVRYFNERRAVKEGL